MGYSGFRKDKRPFVKLFNAGIDAEIWLTNIQFVCWSVVKKYLFPHEPFFYMRPSVMSDLLMKKWSRSISAARCSVAMRELEQMKFIKKIGYDLYMVNGEFAFKGSRSLYLRDINGLDVFGDEDDLPEFLSRSVFHYETIFIRSLRYLEECTGMNVKSKDNEKFIDRVMRERAADAAEMNKKNERFKGLADRFNVPIGGDEDFGASVVDESYWPDDNLKM